MSIAAVRKEYEMVGVNTDQIQSNYLMRAGSLMLLITFLAAVCTISVSFLAARTGAGMAKDLRSDVFRKVEGFSSTEFDEFSTASLITRSTNDIIQIQNVTYMVIRIVFY
jgi:ATP-binding cassette subfamily B protein